MEFTEDDSKMKDVNLKVQISLVCDGSENINDEVLELISNKQQQKAIDKLERYKADLEKIVDYDDSKLSFHILNRTKFTTT